MKRSNIIKSFEIGWIVGLSDNNRVLVETPGGAIFEPYEGPRNTLFGTTLDTTAIQVPEQVSELVRHLWQKKHEVEQREIEAESDDVEQLARELTGEAAHDPTLEELGFDDDTIRQMEI